MFISQTCPECFHDAGLAIIIDSHPTLCECTNCGHPNDVDTMSMLPQEYFAYKAFLEDLAKDKTGSYWQKIKAMLL